MDYKEISDLLTGVSQQDAIDLLVGKTAGTIEFLRKSTRTQTYTYPDRVITRLYIVCRCTRCGDVSERPLNSVCNAIKKGNISCHKCMHLSEEKDLTGQDFHSLTVLGRVSEWKGVKTIWRIRCELCGNESTIDQRHLGVTKSCSCTRRKNISAGKSFRDQLCADGTFIPGISPERALNKNSTTGVRGISVLHTKNCGERYRAYIYFRRKQYTLGTYATIEEATEARKEAEERIYGNFLLWYAEQYPDVWKKYAGSKPDDIENVEEPT